MLRQRSWMWWERYALRTERNEPEKCSSHRETGWDFGHTVLPTPANREVFREWDMDTANSVTGNEPLTLYQEPMEPSKITLLP